MTTCMTDVTGHDGGFIIAKKDREKYYKYFSPQELRYDRRMIETIGYNVVNYGESKGKTYDRCLIYSNKPFLQYLKGKKLGAPEKYYVAVTRARYSIAIVVDTLFGAVGFEKCQISMADDFIEAERYIYNG